MKTSAERPTLSLVIPTYNESENLPHLLQRLTRTLDGAGIRFEIIVVDDDSPDGTWKLAEEMGMRDPRIRLVRRQDERGLATAVVAGWKEARGEILGVMDADLQYPPESLPELLKPILEGHADISVASRYAPGARVEQWGLLREIISRGAILLAKLALPGVLNGLSDPNSGHFLMRRSVIQDVDLRPIGYKILIEILARGRYARVADVPYDYQGRREGISKLGSRQTVEFIAHLAKLISDTGHLGRLLKFFVVGFSGIFVNLGVLWFLTEIYRTYYLYSGAIAAGCAMTSNFIWNEFWTFADIVHGKRTVLGCLRRFFKFSAICSGGGLLNIGALWLLTHLFGIYYLLSAVAAVGAAAAWNYCLNANITWLSLQHEVKLMPASKQISNEIHGGSPSPASYPLPNPLPGRERGG
ncbi:MAG: glycosyltransferase family 2 protein [Deltaproteobacteria bacterium]|nr:glycosyltransferase family 2 protein [Deltaproteobacteria bacterium]